MIFKTIHLRCNKSSNPIIIFCIFIWLLCEYSNTMVAKFNTIEGDNSSPYTIGRKNVKNTIMLFVKDQNLVTLNSGTYSNNVGKLQCFLTVLCVGLSIRILSDPLVYHFIGSGSLKNVLLRKCIRLFMKIDKNGSKQYVV